MVAPVFSQPSPLVLRSLDCCRGVRPLWPEECGRSAAARRYLDPVAPVWRNCNLCSRGMLHLAVAALWCRVFVLLFQSLFVAILMAETLAIIALPEASLCSVRVGFDDNFASFATPHTHINQ